VNHEEILKGLRDAVIEMDADGARMAAEEALRSGLDPADAIARGLSEGMRTVGDRFGKMEIFLSEALASADAYYAALNILRPKISMERAQRIFTATLVMGTIFGDIHTVGKDIRDLKLQREKINVEWIASQPIEILSNLHFIFPSLEVKIESDGAKGLKMANIST